MPQLQLPIFGAGTRQISADLGFEERDGEVTYFYGTLPVFTHQKQDIQSFRMITSQFCTRGGVKQQDIVRAFGVPLSTVKRYCRLYQEKGPSGFYAPRHVRGPAVLTEPVLEQVQSLLDEDLTVGEIADRLGLKKNTLVKAIRAGRVHQREKKTDCQTR